MFMNCYILCIFPKFDFIVFSDFDLYFYRFLTIINKSIFVFKKKLARKIVFKYLILKFIFLYSRHFFSKLN